jgi:aspartate aminotransferase
MLSFRAQRLKPSATLALNAKAQEMAKAGRDVISLAVGEPDWDTFTYIKDEAKKALDEGFTKYTPAAGIPELRSAVVERIKLDLGLTYDANQCTIGLGAKQLIFNLLQVLCNPGDEVIIPTPYWVSYPVMADVAEAKIVTPLCPQETHFKLTPELLKNSLSSKTKVLILNSPNNPTGQVYSEEELKNLATVLERSGVWIISDDIYDKMIFTGQKVAPHIAQFSEKLRPQVLLVNALSKTYSMTGWRLGSLVGDRKIVDACTNYQSQSSSCAVSFAQKAAIKALRGPQDEVTRAMETLQKRRSMVLEGLRTVPGLSMIEPQGAFYMWPCIEKLFGKKTSDGRKIGNSAEFAQALLETEGVAVVPGVEFGLEGYFRMSYTLSEAKLKEGIVRLNRFISSLS